MEELNYHVDFGPFYVHLTQKQKRYLAVRSVIDRILAALALIVLSPLFLAVSVAQKISAPDEPIFFLQKRVGRGAHCFNIIKFRTMKSSAPKNLVIWKVRRRTFPDWDAFCVIPALMSCRSLSMWCVAK